MVSRIPPTYWTNAAILPPSLLCITGIVALANPAQRLTLFEFPTPTSTQDHELTYGLVRVAAARDLAFGLTSIAVWYYGSRKALGCSLLAGALLTITDGVVSRMVIGGNEWKHWIFTPLNLAVGAGLLEWI